ncbi:PAS domain-containing sensor histidine kinase [Sphingomonas oleivorans]|nr:ATP-binding protein [Sphingomonas oleivorans]
MIRSAPERPEDILDLVTESVIVRGLDGRIRLWNDMSETIYGWRRENALGRPLHGLLHSHHPLTIAGIESLLAEKGVWEGELTRSTADGREVRIETRWIMRRDDHGRPVDIVETGRDMTHFPELELETRLNTHRYRNLFQAMAASFWELDFSLVRRMIEDLVNDGVRDLRAYLAAHPDFIRRAMAATHVIDVNEKTVQLFGAQGRAQLRGMNVAPFWPCASEYIYAQALVAAFESRPHYIAETKVATLDGREIDVIFTVCWPTEHKGRGSVLVGIIDISEQVAARAALERIRAELAHAARVSILGELVASIAHEVNQPLAAIATNGEAGLRWLARPEPDVEEVRMLTGRMVADARRAADIIARIRGMAAKRAPEPTLMSLNGLIEEAMLFLRHERQAHDVALTLDLAPDLPPLRADRTQVQQVVVNLAVNAMQAMNQAGSPERALKVRTRPAGPATLLCEMEDSGPGIPPDHLERLFDSFFTTKESGLGIGLSICRSIIEAHGGEIRAANLPGGACFSFTLPAGPAPADHAAIVE